MVNNAKRLVGSDNCHLALDVIKYDKQVQIYVFVEQVQYLKTGVCLYPETQRLKNLVMLQQIKNLKLYFWLKIRLTKLAL